MATSEGPGEGMILGGVDTHKDVHAAAAMGETGRLLGTAEFPTTPVGYRRLLAWLRSFGSVERVGIEGTGQLRSRAVPGTSDRRHVEVVEVNRPNRQWRRAARQVGPGRCRSGRAGGPRGEAVGAPKSQDGGVEAIRMLRLARRSAIKARTQAANQLQGVVEPPRRAAREAPCPEDPCAGVLGAPIRCGAPTTPRAAARFTLKSLAGRWAWSVRRSGIGAPRTPAQESSGHGASRAARSGRSPPRPGSPSAACVRALIADRRAKRSMRIASSTPPSCPLGAPTASPARTARAAASASCRVHLPRRRRHWRFGRFTSTTSTAFDRR